MFLAGIPIHDRLIPGLAERLHRADLHATAERLEAGLGRNTLVLALEIAEREAILRALEDCPDKFAELRGVLVREHTRR